VIRINLLPEKFRKTKGVQRLYTYGIIGLSALAIVMVLLLLNLASQISRTNTRIAQIDSAAAKLADRIAYLRALTAREQESERLRQMIRRLQPDQARWILLLDDLAGLLREDLWLTQIAPDAAGTTPLALAVDGEAYTKISVADFLGGLESSDRFADVQLVALTDTRTAQASQVQFKLKMSYRPEGAGAVKP